MSEKIINIQERVLDIAQAAVELNCKPDQVKTLLGQKKIKGTLVLNKWRSVLYSSIVEYLEGEK